MENKCYSHVAENLFFKWPPLTFDVLIRILFRNKTFLSLTHSLSATGLKTASSRSETKASRSVFNEDIREAVHRAQAFVLKYFGVSGVRWENFQLQKSMKTVCCFVTWTELWSVVFLFEAYIEFFSDTPKNVPCNIHNELCNNTRQILIFKV